MRAMISFAALSLGLAISSWALLHGGGSPADGPSGSRPGAGQLMAAATQAQHSVALKRAEMWVQACEAQAGSFADCDPKIEGVTLTRMDATGYSMRSGNLTASGKTGEFCHATTNDPTNCAAW